MALLQWIDGTRKIVKPEVGAEIWRVMNGEIEPNEDQQQFCAEISRVFLNWRDAPDTYIEANLPTVIPVIISYWQVSSVAVGGSKHQSNGVPTRADSKDKQLVAFCEKWGLIAYGRPTALSKKYF